MYDSGQTGGHDFSGAHDRVESAHEGGQAGGGGSAHAFAGDKTPGHVIKKILMLLINSLSFSLFFSLCV